MKVITDWKILRNKVEEEFDFDNGDCESLGRQTQRILKGIFIGH